MIAIPSEYTSTAGTPFKNLQYLIVTRGVNGLHKDFRSLPSYQSYDADTDTHQNEYIDEYTNEFKIDKLAFDQFLFELFDGETRESLSRVLSRLGELRDLSDDDVSGFIEKTNFDLATLLALFEGNPEFKQYENILPTLNRLQSLLMISFRPYLKNTTTSSAISTKEHSEIFTKKTSIKKASDDSNNILKAKIAKDLENFEPFIQGHGFEILVNALFNYFANGSFPVLETKIQFERINKKRVGWALKGLYKSVKLDILEIEYFRFAQQNINLFAKEIIPDKDFNKSKFYKLFTTNPDN